jgi:hypothetical protein
MHTLLTILIIIIILGALLGANSFGGTIRRGCFFFVILFGLAALALLLLFHL